MEEIGKNTVCKWCIGCNRMEVEEFKGVARCEGFVPGYIDWYEKYTKEVRSSGRRSSEKK